MPKDTYNYNLPTENYVLKKEADWSLFNYGFAIPLEIQVVFKKIADRFLKRGESKKITLYLDGKGYEAKLNNNRIASKFGERADIVQVRYTQNSKLAEMLRRKMHRSYQYLYSKKQLQEPGSRKPISLPEDYKEYLCVYTTEYDDSFVMELITSEEIGIMKEMVRGKPERIVEIEINCLEKDEGAGIQQDMRLVKYRKLNRLIGDNLKMLYGYRCQLCGELIGEEFGSHIAEAHHIDYFIISLNNDADNQMIVCPNHHSIIHDADPVFDRKRKMYIYKNGIEQSLVLNHHL